MVIWWECYKILMYGSKRIFLYYYYRFFLELYYFGCFCFYWYYFCYFIVLICLVFLLGNLSFFDRCSIDFLVMDFLRCWRWLFYLFLYKKILLYWLINILFVSVIVGKFLFGYCCFLGFGKYFLFFRRSYELVDILILVLVSCIVLVVIG